MTKPSPCTSCKKHEQYCTYTCGRYWLWRCIRDYEMKRRAKAYKELEKDDSK